MLGRLGSNFGATGYRYGGGSALTQDDDNPTISGGTGTGGNNTQTGQVGANHTMVNTPDSQSGAGGGSYTGPTSSTNQQSQFPNDGTANGGAPSTASTGANLINLGAYTYQGNDTGFFNGQAQTAQQRGPALAQYDGQAQRNVQMDSAQGQQAMGAQQSALSLDQQAAMGNAPSVAQGQLQQGLDAAQNGAAGIAAGARGNGAGLAQILASQSQATNALQTNQQSAQLRAGEMATARQAYNSDASNLRSSDLNQQNADVGYQGQLAQQAQFQAQQQQAATNQNDQYASQMYALGQGAAQSQLQGTMGYDAQNSTNYNSAAATAAGLTVAQNQETGNIVNGFVGAGSSGLGAYALMSGGGGNQSSASSASGDDSNDGDSDEDSRAVGSGQSGYLYGGSGQLQQAAPQQSQQATQSQRATQGQQSVSSQYRYPGDSYAAWQPQATPQQQGVSQLPAYQYSGGNQPAASGQPQPRSSLASRLTQSGPNFGSMGLQSYKYGGQ